MWQPAIHEGEFDTILGKRIFTSAYSNAETGSFALLFEFDGDVRKIRHVLYNCSASRPSIGGKTNEEEKEVQTETISIKARPLPNGYVKAKTGDETTAETYAGWYSEVYMPVTTGTQEE